MREIFIPEPYQIYSINHLIYNPAAALFLDMGLGKTVITLTAFQHLKKYGAVKRMLIIGPKNVTRSVWPAEVAKWEHLKDISCAVIQGTVKQRVKILESIGSKNSYDVYTINRELVPWLCAYYGGMYLPFCMCVVDESTSFKSTDAVRFKSLSRVMPLLPRRVIETGTPIPNGFEDLWAQIYLLDGGERLGDTKGKYLKEFFYPEAIRGTQRTNYKIIPGVQNAVNDRIKDISISLRSDDLLKLPPVSYIQTPIDLDDKLMKQYRKFKRDKVLELAESLKEQMKSQNGVDFTKFVTAKNAITLSGKLMQFASGAIYNDDNTDSSVYNLIHNEKIEVLDEIIESSAGGVLVACNYRHEYDRIQSRLSHWKPRQYKNEQDVIDWNEGKIKVMYCNARSLSHGSNLQFGGHTIVWLSMTWDLEVYIQFNKRLPRRGQINRVNIYHLICKGTEDERVYARLQEKDALQKDFVEEIKKDINEILKHVI